VGEGSDQVYAGFNYTLADHIEVLFPFGAATSGTGNAGDNVLAGFSASQGLTLDGAGGNDTIYGSAFNDTLLGGAGSDLLQGFGGNDSLVGGADDDYYFLDNAGDVAVESAGQGFDRVYAAFNTTLGANIEILLPHGAATSGTGNADANILAGFSASQGLTLDGQGGNDTIYGSAFNDTLLGGEGNDLLEGYGGNDTMQGGNGNDSYILRDAGDLVMENPGEGSDTVYSLLASTTLADNAEVLFLSGASSVTGIGNASNNYIIDGTGTATGKSMDGLGGQDVLIAGAGADTLTGGSGNDVFFFNVGLAAGDTIVDFDGNGTGAGDVLQFVGYGMGATFTNIDPTHWQVNYNGGTAHDIITFSNAPTIDPSDVLFA
jgi:Ca2+-binding RTX toxin-like protein